MIRTLSRQCQSMPLLPRKGVLAIAAVIDVAMRTNEPTYFSESACGAPRLAAAPPRTGLAGTGALRHFARHARPARRLRTGARGAADVTANDILRAAGRSKKPTTRARRFRTVEQGRATGVWPAPNTNSAWRLNRINLEDMARDAEALSRLSTTQPGQFGSARPESGSSAFAVHDLDSFGAIPLESKVVLFAGLPPRAGSRWPMAVAASRGKGACRTRSGSAGAMRGSASRGAILLAVIARGVPFPSRSARRRQRRRWRCMSSS